MPTGRERPPVAFPEPRKPQHDVVAPAVRDTLLQRARVWREADDPRAALTHSLATAGLSEPIVRCRYLDAPARGTTAKFDCVTADGELLKVKYGHTGEIHAEVAASRLLTALGFGADRMFLVPRVRCYGCARTPFYTAWLLDYVGARPRFSRSIPDDAFTDFEWVAVERRLPGREIETADTSGWAWFELDRVDSSSGANRAERDALRLLAMLVAHWDNKADNQRLICASDTSNGTSGEGRDAAASCAEPFAFIHDLGATFGPNKLDFDGWKHAPIWTDRARCVVSMRRFPYSGGTFRDSRISEAGRQLLLRQLARLDDRDLAGLFRAARFPEFHGGRGAGADVGAWVQVFRDKGREISEAGPCE